MTTDNFNNTIDPNSYRMGWEKAQEEFENYLRAQYVDKTQEAIQRLKNGETFIDSIEAA